MTQPSVQRLLGLKKPPLAIAFLDRPPADVPRWQHGPVPAGCAFWQKAFEHGPFFTLPEDHFGCAVGCHTHKINLPQARAHELNDTIGFMVQNNYLRMEEVPGIPTLTSTPGAVAYGPVDGAGFTPDVVVIAVRPSQAMLLQEAALKAGAGDGLAQTIGRPGCAVLPLTVLSGKAAISLGCRGNRIFTGTPDDEMYFSVPGKHWPAVVEALHTILQANAAMQKHYESKLSA